ncbi:bleomycin resistance protein [Kribbella qitaiheensis]|uniref:Bleomycin resistance protein n=1 Tax=Kribbella qitaiheensis TaxID=1544730 RepID=A0A7G6WSM5_9ACTN|nr:VOC family protein [Kribbella qitaiheensis]QNE16990.1 bleomycin resistance protein [Kribbella qitaiheensis]
MIVDTVFPIVVSSDLPRLLQFYTEVLGGEQVYQFPPEGTPAYVSLRFGQAALGLGHDPAYRQAPGTPAISLWLYVDDCAAAVDEIRKAGGTITQEPVDQPWGEREARVQDPDGNILIIGQHATA